MTPLTFKITEICASGILLPALFALSNLVGGTRPLVTEFELGAITAVVLVRLIEAHVIAFDLIRKWTDAKERWGLGQ